VPEAAYYIPDVVFPLSILWPLRNKPKRLSLGKVIITSFLMNDERRGMKQYVGGGIEIPGWKCVAGQFLGQLSVSGV
jgi:hypothetical protein